MEYGYLRERQRGMQLPVLEIFSSLLLLAALLVGMYELINYSKTKDSLQTDLTIAGIPVGGLEQNEARARWEAVYMNQPVQLFYGGSLIMLDPAEINFETNSDAMLAEARNQNSRQNSFWAGFWNYLWRRPVAAVSVPLSVTYPEPDLRRYLEDLAARYDAPPGDGGLDLGTLTFRSGVAGQRLDIEQSMALIDQALRSPETRDRRVVLPTVPIEATGEQDSSALRQAILQVMESRGFDYQGPDTTASIYVLNLDTGEEVTIQPDVVYSAVSTIKIPIMINLFRSKLLVDQDTAYLLTESILCSNNSASNFLMQIAGNSLEEFQALREGLNQVSCTAQELGADHTFISAPLYVADTAYQFEAAVCRPSTPGNQEITTAPDLYSQTTAEDMGVMLTEIYDCAYGDSGLRAVYPDDITQTECKQMIELLSGNRIDRLIELGVPEGTTVAHKNGWGPETTGDAGIIFSPGADYVFVMYIHERDADNNNVMTIGTWELLEEVSRVTYNYFNPSAPLYEPRDPILPLSAIDCVTVAAPELVDLNNIDANRVDENGNPLPDACYGGAGDCRDFDNWGRQ